MNNQIDLSDFFITKPQADDFRERLGIINDQMFSNNFNLEKVLTEEFGINKKDKFVKLLHDNKIASNIKEFLQTIDEAIANLPLISLTIAFEPKEETLKALSQWFLFSLNKQVLFNFQIDKTLVAGAIVNFNGKFKDYSVKTEFDGIIKQNLANHEVKTTEIRPTTPTPILTQNTEHITIGR